VEDYSLFYWGIGRKRNTPKEEKLTEKRRNNDFKTEKGRSP